MSVSRKAVSVNVDRITELILERINEAVKKGIIEFEEDAKEEELEDDIYNGVLKYLEEPDTASEFENIVAESVSDYIIEF